MDLWDIMSFLWVPCLLIAAFLQIRAIYLKSILVKKYGFKFPQKFLGIVRTDELKTNRRMTELQDLKEVITAFIVSKRWVYILLLIAVLNVVLPYAFRWWIADTRRF